MSSKATTDHPYFCVQKHNGRFETSGDESAQFGHRIGLNNRNAAEGIFAGWHWDGARLVVTNDRYGIYPLFWFRLPDGGICISSSLVRLVELGAPTELDTTALAVLFHFGSFVGEDTPFAAIRAVPPNAAFEWVDGALQCYGNYPKAPSASTISRDEAIDGYIELFAQAMAKRAPASNNFAVPISGGRDSRHILLELHRVGTEPAVCVSARDNPGESNEDTEIGRMLCSKLGFRHETVDPRLTLLSAEVRKNLETHFCALSHGWYLALADSLNGRFDTVYDGLGGDVLSQSSFLNSDIDATFRSHDANAIAARILLGRTPKHSVLKGLVRRPLQKKMTLEIVKQRLSKEIEKHMDMPNPVSSFYFWNRTRRMTSLAPYSLLGGVPRVYAPFLDHDLFDFMSTLPSGMLLDGRFHDDAIARAYPAYSHIPYANDDTASPTDNRHVRRAFLDEATRRLLLRKPWSLMDNVVPRAKLLAGFLSRGRIRPWIPLWIIYLDQIDSLRNQKLPRQ